MEGISIYVKTAELGKTGIHWRYIKSNDNDGQPSEVPSLLQQKILNNENHEHPLIVDDLLDVVQPSLLIFRDGKDNKLLLEVTGIESPKRSEVRGRKVLNSIVFITDDQDKNEQVIRKIAYSTLENMLGRDEAFSQMIQDSIDFYQLEEFRVDLDKVLKFIDGLPNVNSQFNQENNYEIDFYSEEHLQDLANYLKNHPLPEKWNSWNGEKKDGVLILVTDTLEEKTILHEVGVWRGFAKNCQEPEKPEKENKTQQIANLSVTSTTESTEELSVKRGGTPAKKLLPLRLIFLVIIVLTLLLLLVVMLKMHEKNLKINCQNLTNCYPQEQITTPRKN